MKLWARLFRAISLYFMATPDALAAKFSSVMSGMPETLCIWASM